MNNTAFINAAIVGLMAGRLWRHQPPFMREFYSART